MKVVESGFEVKGGISQRCATHWSQALEKTQLAPLTIHDLRHTYASLAGASGADLRYVQTTMGRSTPTATANIYSDLYSDELNH